jgi:hypothetical protein
MRSICRSKERPILSIERTDLSIERLDAPIDFLVVAPSLSIEREARAMDLSAVEPNLSAARPAFMNIGEAVSLVIILVVTAKSGILFFVRSRFFSVAAAFVNGFGAFRPILQLPEIHIFDLGRRDLVGV